MIRVNDDTARAAVAAERGERLVLAHGGGGQLTDELVGRYVLPKMGNEVLNQLMDAADVGRVAGRVALTMDSFVVTPWKFPGGDIGRLAVAGTVNDLAVMGAKAVGLGLGIIAAEGFGVRELDEIMESVGACAREAGVKVVTGDTKVVGRGQADGIYLITAGVGAIRGRLRMGMRSVKAGDVVICSGTIGEHGLAVMLTREMPEVKTGLVSDVAPLNGLVEVILKAGGAGVRFMRDPTRGGLAGVCADLAEKTGLHVVLEEEAIGVRPEALHAAEMLGLDPLEIANEGKVVVVVRERVAERVVQAMRSHDLGIDAAVIGRVESARDGMCELRTNIGGRRIVQKPYGEQLPRIC